MNFAPTALASVMVVDLQPAADERGFFARSWCDEEFAAHGLSAKLVQCSVSWNHRRGTLRGLLYIPTGMAHGFQTLEDGTEVFYQMSEHYKAEAGAGVRWNDPAFAIEWPLAGPILSPRDAAWADFA